MALASVAAIVVLVVAVTGGSVDHRPRPSPTPGPSPTVPTESPAKLPAIPAPPGTQFGVNVNRLFNDQTYAPRAIDAQLRALRATGATVARSDTLWEYIETAAPVDGRHRYDWTFDDRIAGSLAAHGLQWLPIIDYAPVWAGPSSAQLHSPPRQPSEFAAFAAAVAARYGRGGSFWREHPTLPAMPTDTYEIWNEPDNTEFWPPAPDPGRYADLYLLTRAAIRSVDPGARPIVGGLVSSSFVAKMVAARPQLRGGIDGVAIHPYAATPLGVLADIRLARRRLDALGLAAVPLYATEFGWTTRPAGALAYLPARQRPGYITATLAAMGHIDCGLAGAILYTWVTPERNPLSREDWFGIHPPGGGTSADSVAYTQGIHDARAKRAPIRLCEP